MAARDAPAPSGACLFGAERLLPLIGAFAIEGEGVRAGGDIEYVHRMRVASRRLRASLPLFCQCFPEKQYRDRAADLRRVTRALGEARDTDVQIAFLVKYRKKIAGRNGKSAGAPDAIGELLHELRERRAALQKDVVAALDRLDGSGTVPALQAACTAIVQQGQARRRRPSRSGLSVVAADRIAARLDAMLAFGPYVHQPDAVAEHHAMRIAAKKLRYTMEAYAPLYRRGLSLPIARTKRIQQVLGDIHDCDVWIDDMTALILRQRGRHDPQKPGAVAPAAAIPAYRALLQDRERQRSSLYHRFVRFYDALVRQDFFDTFRAGLASGQKAAVLRVRAPVKVPERDAVLAECAAFPLHAGHAAHVAGLALRLFDGLAPVHRLAPRDRALLEYAALLHCTGDRARGREPYADAAARVLAAEGLPLPFADRAAVALAVRLQDAGRRKGRRGLFTLLSEIDQRRVLLLAALLGIADALDAFRTGAVTGVQVTLSAGHAAVRVVADSDPSNELARARSRGVPFTELTGYGLVIA